MDVTDDASVDARRRRGGASRGPHRRARAWRRHQHSRLLRGHDRRGGEQALRHQFLRCGPRRARRAPRHAQAGRRQAHRRRLDRRPDRPALHRLLQRQPSSPSTGWSQALRMESAAARHRGDRIVHPGDFNTGSSPTSPVSAKAYDDSPPMPRPAGAIVELYDTNVQPGAARPTWWRRGSTACCRGGGCRCARSRLADRDRRRMVEVGHLRTRLRGPVPQGLQALSGSPAASDTGPALPWWRARSCGSRRRCAPTSRSSAAARH